MDLEADPRLSRLNDRAIDRAGRAVVYWMQNAQRARDNAAPDVAIRLANEHGVEVVAFFAIDPTVPHATTRTFTFLLDGMRETAAALRERGVGVVIRRGTPAEDLVALARELRPIAVVTDLSPPRWGRVPRERVGRALEVALLVDPQ